MNIPVEDEPISMKVIQTVADEKGVDPTELPPLGEQINPDALNELVERAKKDSTSAVDVTFTFSGVTVRVHDGDGIEAVLANKCGKPPEHDQSDHT
jgi:hypothetical protein